MCKNRSLPENVVPDLELRRWCERLPTKEGSDQSSSINNFLITFSESFLWPLGENIVPQISSNYSHIHDRRPCDRKWRIVLIVGHVTWSVFKMSSIAPRDNESVLRKKSRADLRRKTQRSASSERKCLQTCDWFVPRLKTFDWLVLWFKLFDWLKYSCAVSKLTKFSVLNSPVRF